jgi:hypothetical protein
VSKQLFPAKHLADVNFVYILFASWLMEDSDSDSDDAAAMFNYIASRTALILAAAKNRTRKTHGGSRQGRAPNRDIGHTSASIRLDSDYFCRDGAVQSSLEKCSREDIECPV